MTRILTARFGDAYADRVVLLPATSVDRRAVLGRTMSDGAPARWNRQSAALREIAFPAVHLTQLEDVELLGGHLLRGPDAVYLDNSLQSLALLTEAEAELLGDTLLGQIAQAEAANPPVIPLDMPVLLTNNEGAYTWGHWLIQIFPRIAAAACAMPDLHILVPNHYLTTMPNFGAVLSEFGIDTARLIPIHDNARYRLKTCLLVDYLYHARRVHPYSLEIFDSMREIPALHAGEILGRIAIEREAGSEREIANAGAYADIVTRHRYRLQPLGTRPLGEQIDRWRTTNKIVAVMGSDLANIVFARPGQTVIVLTPAWFGDDFFFDLAAARGVVWHELFCNTIAVQRARKMHSSFLIEPASLDEMLQRC